MVPRGQGAVRQPTIYDVARAGGVAAVLSRPVACVPGVVTDSQRGVRRAVEHLAEPGHRELTYVAGPEASWADGVRWRALRESRLELEIQVRRRADPDEVSVIGFDDIVASGLVSPAPTTVAPPPRTMGVWP